MDILLLLKRIIENFCNDMLYIVFLCGWEPVLIKRIFIGFKAIPENNSTTISDPNLLAKYSKSPVGALDRNKHNHVIENGRCNLCNIIISSIRTKHCSVCNKVRWTMAPARYFSGRIILLFFLSKTEKSCIDLQKTSIVVKTDYSNFYCCQVQIN